jgi:C4-dicarboxylate transporter DctM subunit
LIDPVRLGIIFLANMELGYLTPPVGLNLLISSYRFKKPVPEVLRSVLSVVMVMAWSPLNHLHSGVDQRASAIV